MSWSREETDILLRGMQKHKRPIDLWKQLPDKTIASITKEMKRYLGSNAKRYHGEEPRPPDPNEEYSRRWKALEAKTVRQRPPVP